MERNGETENNVLKESSAVYNAQKKYTVREYREITKKERMELIEGTLYDMASPSVTHQLIVGRIFSCLQNFVDGHQGECVPFTAPMDVQLHMDDWTMMQPDVFVVCDRDKIQKNCIFGAPDFIVEVLSETTRRRDFVIKLKQYMEAGVKEYWIVDAEKQMVIVYDFESQNYPAVYTFSDIIPVHVLHAEKPCKIDFSRIKEKLIDIPL